MGPRRSPWLDDRAELLVRFLDERHQLTITTDAAREDVSNQLEAVAKLMGISRQAAKCYVTDEAVQELADGVAALVQAHHSAIECGAVASLDVKRRQRSR
jgi:hypothetical protein